MIKDKFDTITIDFQSLFETAPNLFIALSPDLKIIGASDAFLNDTNTKLRKIIGKNLFEAFPFYSLADNLDKHGDNKINTAIDDFTLHESLNYVAINKEPHTMAVQKLNLPTTKGTISVRFWCIHNIPVLFEQKQLLCIIHKVEDVTEIELMKIEAEEQLKRKNELEEAEKIHIKKLKESEARFNKIFNLSPIPIFMMTINDNKLILVNNAFENFIELSKENIINKTFLETGTLDKNNYNWFKDQIAGKTGKVSDIEFSLKTQTGELKKMLASSDVVEVDNALCYLVAMIDITERKKQQDSIIQLNKELEAFSYSVSHDLRAPLRAVTGYAQMLDEDYGDVLDSEGKRLLHTISDNAEKMGHLIDNLLTFSRLGRKELLKRVTNMSELVNNAIAEINKSTNHNAKIVVKELNNINSDPELMTQAIINLIENAIKYSSKKMSPIIEISSYKDEDNIVFCITDNGAGFDMLYYDKLFGVFQRLHALEEFDGTGVGLAIVQRIITKHGGKVWATGKVNEGAKFYFSIPEN